MLHPSFEADIDRLSALYRYGLLDEPRDPFLQAVVEKIAGGLGGMTVQIVLVDDHRLFAAASAGRPLDERGKQQSLAAATIEQMDPLIVGDLLKDQRFFQSPSVFVVPNLRAYAGVAVRTPDNYALGVIAASDTKPLALLPAHTALLERGAARVIDHLEERQKARVDVATGALDLQAFCKQLEALAGMASRHRLPLSLLAVDLRAIRAVVQGSCADLGSRVVDRMSGLSRRAVRRLDTFGRLDENVFAMLLPNTEEAGARSLGRRIVDGLGTATGQDRKAVQPGGIGIAVFRPGLDEPQDLIGRAVRDCRRSWPSEPASIINTTQVA